MDTTTVAIFAFLLSVIDLVIILYDRRPRVKIGISKEDIITHDIKTGEPHFETTLLWINISNHSVKKIWVTKMRVEWSWYLWLPLGRNITDLTDLQRWEGESELPTVRFWVDAWGDTILSTNAEDIEYELEHNIFSKRRKIYRIAIQDGTGKWHRSNKIIIKAGKDQLLRN